MSLLQDLAKPVLSRMATIGPAAFVIEAAPTIARWVMMTISVLETADMATAAIGPHDRASIMRNDLDDRWFIGMTGLDQGTPGGFFPSSIR